MSPIIITLVITMTANGQDFSRRESMATIEECWSIAQQRMAELMAHREPSIDVIGIGCFIDRGKPA